MNAGNSGRMIRIQLSVLALLILGLLVPGGRLDAAPAVRGEIAGLAPEEAQKIDPLLWMALAADREAAARGSAPLPSPAAMIIDAKDGGAAGPVLDLLIQVQDEYAGMRPALPVPITAMVGRIATATAVPIARVADLARDPQVARIAPARRYQPMNDVSVPEVGATAAWTEFDTKGSGVIVAIIDTGIDPEHIDFQTQTLGLPGGGTTRLLNLLDLSQPGSGPFGGTLYNAAQINAGLAESSGDPVGHGTHVAGSAAGGGAADTLFRGVAPEADLIIVNADRNGIGSFSTADIVNSLAFVDERAAAFGKPYVANLSLGGHDGAHDGTSLEEVAIDDLVGAGKAGKAVVIAAGNEASGPARHAAAEVGKGSHSFTVLVPPNYQPAPGDRNDFVLVNIWYESSSDFLLTVTPPGGAPLGPVAPGQWNGPSGTLTAQGLIGIQNAVNGTDPENGDREASVILIDLPTPPAGGNWLFTLEGDHGHFDAYIAQNSIFNSSGQATRFTSDVQFGGFVAEPGTARNAITVGAHVSKLQWTDLDQIPHDLRDFFFGITVGARASFSNIGPTRDGRLKPEITAPGQIIASCFSHDAPPGSPASAFNSPFPDDWPNFFILNESYALQQGTSQASPHVAGAVALVYSLHPEWDIMDVRQALTATAREDGHTGIPPNAQFGYGKLDVLEALRAAETPGPLPGDVNGDNEVDIADAQLAIQYVLETAAPIPGQEYLADMNRDGAIDVTDVVLIVRAALATGGALAALPPAGAGGGAAAGSYILPVTIEAGEHVAGIDVQLASRSHRPDAAATIAASDRVLALGAGGRDAGSARVIALSLDGSNLAGRQQVICLPFQPAAGTNPPAAADWTVGRLTLIAPGGKQVPGAVKLGAPFAARATPVALKVMALGPEPAPGGRAIAFELPARQAITAGESETREMAKVRVGIYDAGGRLVRELADGYYEPGRHEVTWDGRGPRGRVATGAYWVRVEVGGEVAASRLTVLR
jgi:subtilisin family serine protease